MMKIQLFKLTIFSTSNKTAFMTLNSPFIEKSDIQPKWINFYTDSIEKMFKILNPHLGNNDYEYSTNVNKRLTFNFRKIIDIIPILRYN